MATRQSSDDAALGSEGNDGQGNDQPDWVQALRSGWEEEIKDMPAEKQRYFARFDEDENSRICEHMRNFISAAYKDSYRQSIGSNIDSASQSPPISTSPATSALLANNNNNNINNSSSNNNLSETERTGTSPARTATPSYFFRSGTRFAEPSSSTNNQSAPAAAPPSPTAAAGGGGSGGSSHKLASNPSFRDSAPPPIAIPRSSILTQPSTSDIPSTPSEGSIFGSDVVVVMRNSTNSSIVDEISLDSLHSTAAAATTTTTTATTTETAAATTTSTTRSSTTTSERPSSTSSSQTSDDLSSVSYIEGESNISSSVPQNEGPSLNHSHSAFFESDASPTDSPNPTTAVNKSVEGGAGEDRSRTKSKRLDFDDVVIVGPTPTVGQSGVASLSTSSRLGRNRKKTLTDSIVPPGNSNVSGTGTGDSGVNAGASIGEKKGVTRQIFKKIFSSGLMPISPYHPRKKNEMDLRLDLTQYEARLNTFLHESKLVLNELRQNEVTLHKEVQQEIASLKKCALIQLIPIFRELSQTKLIRLHLRQKLEARCKSVIKERISLTRKALNREEIPSFVNEEFFKDVDDLLACHPDLSYRWRLIKALDKRAQQLAGTYIVLRKNARPNSKKERSIILHSLLVEMEHTYNDITALSTTTMITNDSAACIKTFVDSLHSVYQEPFNRLVGDERVAEGQSLHTFLKELKSYGYDRVPPSEIISYIQSYVKFLQNMHHVPDSDLPKLHIMADRYIWGHLVGTTFFSIESGNYEEEDARFRRQLQQLHDLSPLELGVEPRFLPDLVACGTNGTTVVPFYEAIEILGYLDLLSVPSDMLHCIYTTAKLVHHIARHYFMESCGGDSSSFNFGADEFFPIFVYVVVQSNLIRAYTTVHFLQKYGLPAYQQYPTESGLMSDRITELSYFLTCLEGALVYIDSITQEQLEILKSKRVANKNASDGGDKTEGAAISITAQTGENRVKNSLSSSSSSSSSSVLGSSTSSCGSSVGTNSQIPPRPQPQNRGVFDDDDEGQDIFSTLTRNRQRQRQQRSKKEGGKNETSVVAVASSSTSSTNNTTGTGMTGSEQSKLFEADVDLKFVDSKPSSTSTSRSKTPSDASSCATTSATADTTEFLVNENPLASSLARLEV